MKYLAITALFLHTYLLCLVSFIMTTNAWIQRVYRSERPPKTHWGGVWDLITLRSFGGVRGHVTTFFTVRMWMCPGPHRRTVYSTHSCANLVRLNCDTTRKSHNDGEKWVLVGGNAESEFKTQSEDVEAHFKVRLSVNMFVSSHSEGGDGRQVLALQTPPR